MSDSTPIPAGHLETVCKSGQGAYCCIFAAFDINSKQFTCEKHGGLREAILRRQRSGTMVANSVNCTGAPDFIPSEELPCAHCGMTMEHVAGKCTVCGTEGPEGHQQ